jgi:hypothetical protein
LFNTLLNIKPASRVFLQNFDLILANIRQIFVKTYKHYGPSTPHRSGPSSSKTVREKQGNHREGLPDPGQGRGEDVCNLPVACDHIKEFRVRCTGGTGDWRTIHVPVIIETHEDGIFIISCPRFRGCHSLWENHRRGTRTDTGSHCRLRERFITRSGQFYLEFKR